jgi:hypothetical protein
VSGRSLLAAGLLAVACAAPAGDPVELVLAGERRIEARGLPEVTEPEDGWSALFNLSVASAHRRGGPAVIGRYELDAGTLVFVPRYALEPELEYTVVLRRSLLPGAVGDELDLVQSVAFPRAQAASAPVVTALYPTARPLPSNVLKFYVLFSRPMARGFAYTHTRVLDASGAQVERPFLELNEELWNPAGTRLTLLVDPGRIKRGLLLHEQMGPVLEPERGYTLLIAAGWPGADGAVLAADRRVDFTTSAADLEQPDPRRWQLGPPVAASRNPLTVTLDEPLDHALLQRMIRVVRMDGVVLAGEVSIHANETRWSFVPRDPWAAAPHELAIDSDLEDLAGNSVGRPFEDRLVEPPLAAGPQTVRIPFRPL